MIAVRPGEYRECVIVDRDVEIVGEGAPARVVIEALGHNTVTFNTESACLSNVTVKASRSNAAHSAVAVLQGRPTIEGCVLSSDCGTVVLVTGSESAPVLRGCTIRDGKAAGIVVEQSSQAVIEKCFVTANHRWGIIVTTGGNPVIRDCEIWNNLSGGILVRDKGTGTIERCQIYGNTDAGI
ncbi:MAG: right-handed parallel beta-helix repeat-containing protein, partial [Actinobacteria bacterium]|nr:right-handed parallel beta-helix repeat-containing protein [Actinomycetota bacterium]